jgi:glycosyltransferase involved in cell wall biosynthesis
MISIILPVKNEEKFIQDCLLSIQNQTEKDWEAIIVDDHSEDHTSEIIRPFKEEDRRIRLIQNQGTGIISALQTGFEASKGELITRMDGDDLMTVDRLQLMKNAIKNQSEAVVTGLVRYFPDSEVSKGYRNYEAWLNHINLQGYTWQYIYRECPIASPNWMMKRSDLILAGGFKSLNYPEDYHLALRWYQAGYQVVTVPEITLWWREHAERTSKTSYHYHQRSFFHLKINFLVDHVKPRKSWVIWGNNPKSSLTKKILSHRGVTPLHCPKRDSFSQIEKCHDYYLLIAVYPSKKEREAILSYLDGLQLVMGKDYWFL